MKRGCLPNLVVLAAATALWGLYLVPRISDEDTGLVLTVCGGLLTSVTVWTVWKIAAFRKDRGRSPAPGPGGRRWTDAGTPRRGTPE